jgi:hypothetical protein
MWSKKSPVAGECPVVLTRSKSAATRARRLAPRNSAPRSTAATTPPSWPPPLPVVDYFPLSDTQALATLAAYDDGSEPVARRRRVSPAHPTEIVAMKPAFAAPRSRRLIWERIT